MYPVWHSQNFFLWDWRFEALLLSSRIATSILDWGLKTSRKLSVSSELKKTYHSQTSFCVIEDLKLFYCLRGLALLFLIGDWRPRGSWACLPDWRQPIILYVAGGDAALRKHLKASWSTTYMKNLSFLKFFPWLGIEELERTYYSQTSFRGDWRFEAFFFGDCHFYSCLRLKTLRKLSVSSRVKKTYHCLNSNLGLDWRPRGN